MNATRFLAAACLCAACCLADRASAAVDPIPVTGWNHDLILNNPAPHDVTITGTMDGGFGQAENWTWVEAGDYTDPNGDPITLGGIVAGTHSSLTGNGTFEFQPADELNTLGLNGGASGTLTLDTPAAYSAIALYGASGFGPKSASVELTFSDASTTLLSVANDTGIGHDWFHTGPENAYAVGVRASNKSEEGFTRLFYQQNDAIHVHESYFALSAADQGKLLQSVTITNDGGDRMAIFALSGQVVPEPGSVFLLGLGALTMLASRRRSA